MIKVDSSLVAFNQLVGLPTAEASVNILLEKIPITDFQMLGYASGFEKVNLVYHMDSEWPVVGAAKEMAVERIKEISTLFAERVLEKSRQRFCTLESIVDFARENKKAFIANYTHTSYIHHMLWAYESISKRHETGDIGKYFRTYFSFVVPCTSSRTLAAAKRIENTMNRSLYTELTSQETFEIYKTGRELNNMEYMRVKFMYLLFIEKRVEASIDSSLDTPPAPEQEEMEFDRQRAIVEGKPRPNSPLESNDLEHGDSSEYMNAMWKGLYEGQYFSQNQVYCPSLKLQIFYQMLNRMPESMQHACIENLLNTMETEEMQAFITVMSKGIRRYDLNKDQLDMNKIYRAVPVKKYLSTITDFTDSEPLVARLFVECLKAKDLEGLTLATRLLNDLEQINHFDYVPRGTWNVYAGAKSILSPGDFKLLTDNYVSLYPLNDQLENLVNYFERRRTFQYKYLRTRWCEERRKISYTEEEITKAFEDSMRQEQGSSDGGSPSNSSNPSGSSIEELERRLVELQLPSVPSEVPEVVESRIPA